MNQSLPERRLSYCKTKEKFSANSRQTANCAMLLTIYPKELKTVSRLFGCVRDGDTYACPVCNDCCGLTDGGNCRSSGARQGACASGSSASESSSSPGDARVRRAGPDAGTGGSRRFNCAETPPCGPSDDLPLRRADRRAALSQSCATLPARSAASRGSPGSRHRRPLQTRTSRMGAKCSGRPSAGAVTA